LGESREGQEEKDEGLHKRSTYHQSGLTTGGAGW
jgi:hypothetical protein